jgi:hypothetical protein
MALTLIKEDGSGMANANSYANAADGDTYHEGHLYATAWTGATSASKEAALVMATRVIDALFRFNGFKRMATQGLQWPRRECRDPDAQNGIVPGLLLIRGPFLDETKVPAVVVQATCEMARELLAGDRTGDPDGAGMLQINLTGSLTAIFDTAHPRPVVPRLVRAMLAPLGSVLEGGGGEVRLVRC